MQKGVTVQHRTTLCLPACTIPALPWLFFALLSPRGNLCQQRFQAQHKNCGPAVRWQETIDTPRAGEHIGWVRIDPCSSL